MQHARLPAGAVRRGEAVYVEVVPFEEFARLELRVARVKAVVPHPNADRLYLLTIEAGEERTIVAGIRAHYTPEQLLGRNIIVVWNLEPAVIRGVPSQGMMLAAQDGNEVSLLTTDKPLAAGSRVR